MPADPIMWTCIRVIGSLRFNSPFSRANGAIDPADPPPNPSRPELLPPPPSWKAFEMRLRDCAGTSSGSAMATTTATTAIRGVEMETAFAPRLAFGGRMRRPHDARTSSLSRPSRTRKPAAAKANHTHETGWRGTAPATV